MYWLAGRRLPSSTSPSAYALFLGPEVARGGEVEHHSVARRVEGVRAPAGGDRLGAHLLGLAVDEVGGRIAGNELQLEDHEAPRGRGGVRPCQALVEAAADRREAGDGAAHDVVAAGNREVGHPPALGPAPRGVRVGQHHPGAVLRPGRAQADAVGAQRGLGRSESPVERRGIWPARGGGARRGAGRRLGVDQAGDEARRGRRRHDLLVPVVEIPRGDRLHPRLAPAGRVAQLARAQVRVVARGPAPVERLGVRVGPERGLLGGGLLDHA